MTVTWQPGCLQDRSRDEANARLIAQAPAMYEKLVKVCKWLDGLAADAENQARTSNFITLTEACEHDAKNYRATANDIRAVLSKIEGK